MDTRPADAGGVKARQAADTRRRLLAAAERVFRRDGVAAATLEAVAIEAGLTRGALYWHFRGKAALLRAVLEPRLPLEQLSPTALCRSPAAVLAQAVVETVSDPALRGLCQLLVRNPEEAQVHERIAQASFRLQRGVQRALAAQPPVPGRRPCAGWVVRACILGFLIEGLAHPRRTAAMRTQLEEVLARALGAGSGE